jgi:pyridinium-3,5-bisthiocarboxylic acid mononucleotide nickel chelatase
MGSILYFDCFSGASGDMVLAALIDAGLPLAELHRALGSLALEATELRASRVQRAGISATKFAWSSRNGSHHHHGPPHHHAHHHDHDHEHEEDQGHRTLEEILALVARSNLSTASRDRAAALFRRLAEAEAEIHGISVDRVHLHEVGALDSIIDIVGGVFAIDWFGADEIAASSLNVGSGMVRCAHGTFPVPAPATAKLVAGVPTYASGPPAELLTPTGALLVTGHASSYGPLPPMVIEKIGYGAGDRDFPEAPNVLRVFFGQRTSVAPGSGGDRVVVIECEIDDMNPQIFGALMGQLTAAGALDVMYAPVQMKKNRPGVLVTVIARPEDRELLSALLFRETTTIGLRYHEVQRERLERRMITVETPLGPIRFKVARRNDAVINAAPEFDDCAQIAGARGLAIKDVQAIAVKAYLEQKPPNT